MSEAVEIRTCGRDSTCDLVLEHPTVSPVHAQIELAGDGMVSIRESDAGSATFLHRNDNWIRIRKVCLCIGDRIRFGEFEVPLDQLISVFGKQSNARLEAKHFALHQGNISTRLFTNQPEQNIKLHKPRRNPSTGKIEDGPEGNV